MERLRELHGYTLTTLLAERAELIRLMAIEERGGYGSERV